MCVNILIYICKRTSIYLYNKNLLEYTKKPMQGPKDKKPSPE